MRRRFAENVYRLSVGEVALLSGEGGLDKSYVTLALAVAGALTADLKQGHGAACGLRAMPEPVALVSYEDSPARIYGRLGRMGQTAAANRIHSLPNPPPLVDGGQRRLQAGRLVDRLMAVCT